MKRFIPDFITSMNIACGVTGVIFAFSGRIDLAFLFMLAAAVFDFFDGFAARALNAYSDLGKELDSLCDCVSFGVLPAVMLFNCGNACQFGQSWTSWFVVLICVFSALRLAKFNTDPRQSSSFIGLPTPACAILLGALCHYVAHDPASAIAGWMASPVFIPVISVVMSYLLICEIPMFSFKFHKDDPKPLKIKRLAMLAVILIAILLCVIFNLNWSLAAVMAMTCYIVKNIIYCILDI